MKPLVVYYSWTGNTERIAKALAAELDAPLACIEEQKERRRGWGFVTGGFQAFFGIRTPIVTPDLDWDSCDPVWLGSPVWATKPAPAVRSFIDGRRWEGRTVHIFMTLADTRTKGALQRFAKILTDKGAHVQSRHAATIPMSRKLGAEEAVAEVQQWLASAADGT